MKTIPTAKAGGRSPRRRPDASERTRTPTFREEVARFANLVPVLLAYVGVDERHRVANRAYQEWFGVRAGGLRGAHLRDVLGADLYAAIRPRVTAVLRGHRVAFEMSFAHPDGRPRVVEATWVPRVGADGDVRGFFALLVDITAHKRAEEALRAIMEGTARATGDDFFQSLVTHLAAALDVSVAFVGEVTDATATKARVLALWLDGELQPSFEYELAGTPCANVVGRALSFYPDKVQGLFPQDAWLREVKAQSYLAVPIFDAAGKAIGHMGVLDCRPMGDGPHKTALLRVFAARAGAELERKRAEQTLRERDEQLRQSHKMEAIGTFASGIAHDLGNMLGAIRGYSELAMPGVPPGTLAYENLQEVLRAADRAKAFVQQILLFGRPEQGTRELVCVSAVVRDVLGLVAVSLGNAITIRTRVETEPDEVWADIDQLRRVVLNLCTNAGQAMPEGGVLEVAVDCVEGSATYRTALGNLDSRLYVRVTVTDTGSGILPEVMPHIFEPFFTTKARGDGSGLGLAVVERIVTGHGGAIAVESTPARGTSFAILLPHVASAGTRRLLEDGPVPRGSGRVLLVDDDEPFVRMHARMLESIGYEVVSCTSGVEALATFAAAPGAFAAVVTDQTMPEMTGATLAAKLIALRPDVPIVLCTAFSQTITPEVAKALGVREYLTKPSSLRELADALRRVTVSPRGGEATGGAHAGDRGRRADAADDSPDAGAGGPRGDRGAGRSRRRRALSRARQRPRRR